MQRFEVMPAPHTKILLVQTAFIGDVILATPLAEAAHRLFHPGEVHFAVIPAAANLLEKNPFIQRIWVYDKRRRQKGGRALWQFARALRKERFDLAVIPHRSLRSALLAWLAQIPRRIGFDRSAGSFLFTDRIPYAARHEVERNLELLRPFGALPGDLHPAVYWDEADAARVERMMPASPQRRKIALAPGSVWATKRWPAERFAELAGRLIAQSQAEIFLIGGREDAALCQGIQTRLNAHCHNLAGSLTLRQSAALLQRCEALISNDSAPAHLGVAAGCRVLMIYGPTVPRFGFAPHGEGHAVIEKPLPCRPCSMHGGQKCPLGTHACMQEIQVEEVLARVFKMLNQAPQAWAAVLPDEPRPHHHR